MPSIFFVCIPNYSFAGCGNITWIMHRNRYATILEYVRTVFATFGVFPKVVSYSDAEASCLPHAIQCFIIICIPQAKSFILGRLSSVEIEICGPREAPKLQLNESWELLIRTYFGCFRKIISLQNNDVALLCCRHQRTLFILSKVLVSSHDVWSILTKQSGHLHKNCPQENPADKPHVWNVSFSYLNFVIR